MSLDALITGLLVSAAAVYLGWYAWSQRKGANRCAGCPARLRSR